MKYTISLNRHKIAKPTNVKKDQSKQKSYTDIHNSYVQIQDLSPVVVFFLFFFGVNCDYILYILARKIFPFSL